MSGEVRTTGTTPPRTAGSRRYFLAAGIIAAAALVGSGIEMMRRIAAFNRDADLAFWVFQIVNVAEFNYAGRPVSLTQGEQGGVPYVDLRYGDEERRLPVTIPPRFEVADLLVTHHDWLRVLRFLDATGKTFEEVEIGTRTGDIPDRLVIVTKSPRPGSDPATWGQVWKKDWTFNFYELRPDGSIAEQRLKYPQGRVGTLPGPDELAENTWEYEAALHLMPRGPTGRFRNSAIETIGWPLPVAAVSGMVMLVGLGFAFAPRRADRWNRPAPR